MAGMKRTNRRGPRRVTFVGETGRPETDEVVIVGRTFRRGVAVSVAAADVEALQAHPQYGTQFEFMITE